MLLLSTSKKSLNYTPDITFTSAQYQLCAARILADSQPITLATVYCSPSYTTNSADFDLLFQILEGTWLVGGDFNAKHSSWGSRTITTLGRALATVLEQRNFEAFSSGEPPYWPTDHRNIPDVIDFFVTNHLHRQQCQVSAITDLSSDHIPVHLQLGLQPSPRYYTHSLVNRHTDWDLYRDHIEAASQHHLPIDTELKLETAAAQFTFALQEAARLSTPPNSLIIRHTTSPVYSNL